MITLGKWQDRHALWIIFYADPDIWTSTPVVSMIFPKPIIYCSYDTGWFGQFYIRLWGYEFTIQMSQRVFWFLFDQLYS